MTAPTLDLPLLRARLLAVEDLFAEVLNAALPLLRDPDPAVRKAAVEALALSPERMGAALESFTEPVPPAEGEPK